MYRTVWSLVSQVKLFAIYFDIQTYWGMVSSRVLQLLTQVAGYRKDSHYIPVVFVNFPFQKWQHWLIGGGLNLAAKQDYNYPIIGYFLPWKAFIWTSRFSWSGLRYLTFTRVTCYYAWVMSVGCDRKSWCQIKHSSECWDILCQFCYLSPHFHPSKAFQGWNWLRSNRSANEPFIWTSRYSLSGLLYLVLQVRPSNAFRRWNWLRSIRGANTEPSI